MVELVHPDLIKEFYNQENNDSYPKKSDMLGPLRRLIGDGLIFSEGNRWKTKRKILNRVFNFQLLKAITGKVAEICDDSINIIEKDVAKKTNDGFLEFNIVDLTGHIFANSIM